MNIKTHNLFTVIIYIAMLVNVLAIFIGSVYLSKYHDPYHIIIFVAGLATFFTYLSIKPFLPKIKQDSVNDVTDAATDIKEKDTKTDSMIKKTIDAALIVMVIAFFIELTVVAIQLASNAPNGIFSLPGIASVM